VCSGDERVQEGKRLTVREIKVIVERHSDGYPADPLRLRGAVVGEGDTYEQPFADATSAIRFHVETFGLTESRIIQ
jgi:hypothetical protein